MSDKQQRHTDSTASGLTNKLHPQRLDGIAERRQGPRRNFTLASLGYGFLYARRRQTRRQSDHHSVYLDWHEPRLRYIALGILLLSCLDAVMTLNLLQAGAVELNPLMAALIERSVVLFVYTKLGLTSISLIFLVAYSNFRVFRLLKTSDLLSVSLLIYLLLTGYEAVLLGFRWMEHM